MSHRNLSITASTLTNALGQGIPATLDGLRARRSGLRPCDFGETGLETWIGRVGEVEQVVLPPRLANYDCRNNRLAQLALEQDGFTAAVSRHVARYGAPRIGLFLGTSTSGIEETESAYRSRNRHTGQLPPGFDLAHTHLFYSVVGFVRELLGLRGPALAVSTACSSSAKVFAVAWRHIHAGLCDAAVVGGVDSLCLTTLCGFDALQLVAKEPCRPWDGDREGISIGEAAGFALLEPNHAETGHIAVLGYGESSDAYHIAAPHPEGLGAALAMQRALQMAGLTARNIDYINLHGTATTANDASEDAALRRVFDHPPPFGSTKGWTGHTLGAAGITEAIIAALAIQRRFIPGTLNTRRPDTALSAGLVLDNQEGPVRNVLSNSFGFGGSNCSLVIGEAGR